MDYLGDFRYYFWRNQRSGVVVVGMILESCGIGRAAEITVKFISAALFFY